MRHISHAGNPATALLAATLLAPLADDTLEVVGQEHKRTTVTADVRGPAGPYRVSARHLVACDGTRST